MRDNNMLEKILIILLVVGLGGCQQQTQSVSNKQATLTAFSTSGAIASQDYQFSNAKSDNAQLDVVMTLEEAARFENRIGIGAPQKRVNRYVGKTRRDAINLVVSELENFQDNFVWPDWIENVTPISFFERAKKQDRFYCGESMFEDSLRMELSKRLLISQTPQFERLFLLWLDHFSVEFKAYSQSHAYAEHLRIIRSNATSTFTDLLRNVVNDPGMLIYLNNDVSTVKKPNENLAREFLELFALGEGKYDEKDIKILAKAIAPNGVNFVSEKPKWYSSKASGREFKAFGLTYKNFNEFVTLISRRADFGEMIAKKFYREFVSITPPNPNDIALLMDAFRKSNFSIAKLFEATISLNSFWSDKTRLNIVKSPIELLYGTARTLGYAGSDMDDHIWMMAFATELGQDLFNPPNIAGFPGGKAWVEGQMMEKRIELIDRLFSDYDLKSNSSEKIKKTTSMDKARSRGQQTRVREIDAYRSERKDFFKALRPDQLGVETILINQVSRDFDNNRWRNIEAAFYNVQLNGRVWDGITIQFGNDNNERGKLGDYIRVEQGKSNPDAFKSNAYNAGFVNDRGLKTLKFSYPSGGDQRRKPSNSDDKLLIQRLSQAMQIVLDHDRAYSQLSTNTAAKNWLQRFVKKVGVKDVSYNGNSYPPVRMFAIENGVLGGNNPYPRMKSFACGFNQSKHNFNKARQIPVEFDNFQINKTEANNSESQIIQLLLPDLANRLGSITIKQALTHEGYQLR